VEPAQKLTCKVRDKLGEKSFFISIDVDLDAHDLIKEEKVEILEAVQILARNIAHKLKYILDEDSIKIL
jgi:hypothetical protein